MDYCEAYAEAISAAVDGALSPEEQAALDAHLAVCPGCRALLHDLQTIHAAMADLPPVEVPDGLCGRIMDAVEQEKIVPLPAKRPARRKTWLAVAAMAALVLAGAWGLTSRSPAWNMASGAAPMAAAGNAAAEVSPDDQVLFAARSAEPADPAPESISAPQAVPQSETTDKAAAPKTSAEQYAAASGSANNAGVSPRGALDLVADFLYAADHPDAVRSYAEDGLSCSFDTGTGSSGTVAYTGEDDRFFYFSFDDGSDDGQVYTVDRTSGTVQPYQTPDE